MGTYFKYHCNKCDYETYSSGKFDYGLFAVVKPFICDNCKDVFDAQIGEEGQVIPEKLLNEMQKEEYYRCPECKGKKLTEWNPRYRKCPKCNGRMLLDKTEYPMLWD